MEEFVLYITIKIRTQEKEMIKTEVQYVVRSFVVKLRGLNVLNV